MSKLTDFIEKQIQSKKEQRWVIPSEHLFMIFESMGIMDEQDILMDILEYLENNKIDVNFKSEVQDLQFRKFKSIEKAYQMRKILGVKSDEIKKHINKVMNTKVTINDTYFKQFMTDDEEILVEMRQKLPSFDEDLQKLQSKIDKEKTDDMVRQIENIPIDQTVIDIIRNNI